MPEADLEEDLLVAAPATSTSTSFSFTPSSLLLLFLAPREANRRRFLSFSFFSVSFRPWARAADSCRDTVSGGIIPLLELWPRRDC